MLRPSDCSLVDLELADLVSAWYDPITSNYLVLVSLEWLDVDRSVLKHVVFRQVECDLLAFRQTDRTRPGQHS